MFCNYCGARLQQEFRFCGVCGKPTPQPAAPAAGRVASHIRLVAIFWIVLSALRLLSGGGGLIGAGILHHWDHVGWGHHYDLVAWPLGHFLPPLLSAFGVLSLLLAIGGFAAAWGLLERRPWARTLALILAFLTLPKFPFGTAIAIYTLWVLLPAESATDYRRISQTT